MAILITGGAGYIGSHTCVALLEAGYDIVVIDNFGNSQPEALRRVKAIAGRDFPVYNLNLLDTTALAKPFLDHDIDAVIHFAALKAVAESIAMPLEYYHNNLTGTIHLCQTMQHHGVKCLVYSSSATVYGQQQTMPLTEDMPLGAINPYGHSKIMLEQILRDLAVSDSDWSIALLRYFNPIGAHPSGLIGEDPNGIPSNLVPHIAKVAVGKLPELPVYGDDYPTPDGTCIRDYIHVMDLATGHVKALEKMLASQGAAAYNLGTGRGYSVLEVIRAYEEAVGRPIPFRITARRAGDVPVSYADPSKAMAELGWRATYNLTDMCRDSWHWQSSNPNGYASEASADLNRA